MLRELGNSPAKYPLCATTKPISYRNTRHDLLRLREGPIYEYRERIEHIERRSGGRDFRISEHAIQNRLRPGPGGLDGLETA